MASKLLTILWSVFGRSRTNGPENIVRARRELSSNEGVTSATMGLPRLEDYSGEYVADVKAVIPLRTEKYTNPAPLTFDVDGTQIEEFCAAYGLEVDDIGALEGCSVPIRWVDGSPIPNWKRVRDSDLSERVDDGEM